VPDAELPSDQSSTETPPTESPIQTELRRAPSLVIVNTGNGKGKSTAAFGMALRALGRGWNVRVIQFLKSGEWKTGEEDMLTKLGADWWSAGDGFTWDSTDMESSKELAITAWRSAAETLRSGSHQLLILDEVTYPMTWGWISTDDVVAAIAARSSTVNVVATGRDAPTALIDLADTVTTMDDTKHAYRSGIAAKRGIDY
jgi:cob(I)alamin adenosyltransferase